MSIEENESKTTMPTETSPPPPPPPPSPPPTRDFVRDIYLWRNKWLSLSVATVSTVGWVLIEIYGYTAITVLSWAGIVTVASLFLWGNVGPLLGKEVPDIAAYEISRQSAADTALAMRRTTEEKIRSLFRVIVHRDWLALAELVVGLWVLSFIGSWFDLLTLLYIGLLGCLTCPVIYQKYENQIKGCVERVKAESKRWCTVVDEKVFKRVRAMVDEKVLKKMKRKDEEVKVKKTE